MSSEGEKSEEVILEIEGTQIKCDKKQLSQNSDYFKAMFEGEFIEKDKDVVKIEGIDLKAMNILLSLLWDELYVFEDEDILLVLQASCMLQFDKIKQLLIERITEILCPFNCMNIWYITERLDIKPLWMKAKVMALEEFSHIKDLDFILELDLKCLLSYLANKNLKCDSEMDVFQTGMKWWYENSKKYESGSEEVLFMLLTCLDYNDLSNSDIIEMKTYPDICGSKETVEVLNCLLDMRINGKLSHSEVVMHKAKILFSSERRVYEEYPCFIFPNQLKVKNTELVMNFRDVFKRKRSYSVLEDNAGALLSVVYYDEKCNKIEMFFNIPKEKCEHLDGFKLVGYKEFVFLFGGEYLMGKGNWNQNFWVFDTIRERWERKCVMPYKRRHFITCICGDYLFIIGGTGNFRVIQANMFWYNYKKGKWSNHITLPCFELQIKCCEYKNQLFMLNVNNKCGYLFDVNKSTWLKLNIWDKDNIMPRFTDNFSLFSYKGSIFLKSEILIELKVVDDELSIINTETMQTVTCARMDSVLCGNILYTLYVQEMETDEDLWNCQECVILEKFSLETHTAVNVLEKVMENDFKPTDCYGHSLHTFRFRHEDLALRDDFVTKQEF